MKAHFEAVLEGTSSWQTRRFEPVRARYVCFEVLKSQNDDGYASCAELVFLDAAGRELPKTGWKVAYASSEAFPGLNGTRRP